MFPGEIGILVTVASVAAAAFLAAYLFLRPGVSGDSRDRLSSVLALVGLAFVALSGLLLTMRESGGADLVSPALPTVVWMAVTLFGGALTAALVERSSSRRRLREVRAKADAQTDDIRRLETCLETLVQLCPRPAILFHFEKPISTSLPVSEQVRRSYSGVIASCNLATAKLLEHESVADVKGTRLGDLPAALDTVNHDRMVADFVRNDYRLDYYEHAYPRRDGGMRKVRLMVRGQVEDERLVSAWIVEVDALDAEGYSTDVQLERNLVSRVSSRLLTSPPDQLKDALQSCLRDLCRYTDADRAVAGWFDREKRLGAVESFWLEAGPPPGTQIARAGFAWALPKFEAGEVVSFQTIDELPDDAHEDRAALERYGVRSAIVSPLMIDDKHIGVLSLTTSTRHRKWPARYEPLLRVVAASIAAALSRAKDREQLAGALQELKEARDRLTEENVILKQEILAKHDFDEIIGDSAALNRCLAAVSRVAETEAPVLILGETGTGKELIAHAIHERSPRKVQPMVTVNCAALPANLIESELFGHVKGAFTGAVADKAGRFDLADGGTILLDEIGELPVALQAKLLRVLQDGEYQRIGDDHTSTTNVRLIAATNRDLESMVDKGQFRSDLFYRINTFPVTVPPLRERGGDVALLVHHFVKKYAAHFDKNIETICQQSLDALEKHDWPGNVRELEGLVQRSLITAEGTMLSCALPGRDSEAVARASATENGAAPAATDNVSPPIGKPALADLQTAETRHIETVLAACGWQISGDEGAAAQLGLPPSTLRSRMKKYGIERPGAGA